MQERDSQSIKRPIILCHKDQRGFSRKKRRGRRGVDELTTGERLSYARCFIEVSAGQNLPKSVVGVNHTHAQGHPSRSADSSENSATPPSRAK